MKPRFGAQNHYIFDQKHVFGDLENTVLRRGRVLNFAELCGNFAELCGTLRELAGIWKFDDYVKHITKIMKSIKKT